MSESTQEPHDAQPVLSEATAKRGSLMQNVIKGAAAVALVATGATLAALRPWQNNGATPAQAREAIAEHQFDHPRIQSVVDTHQVVKGRNMLDITLKLPTDPTAAADMKQYAAEDSAVTWIVPSGVISYTVSKDPKSGKYLAGNMPGFMLSSLPVPSGGEGLTIKNGTSNVAAYPNVHDPVGTEVAFFVTTEAMTSTDQDLTTTDGKQYLGTVEKTPAGWELMSEQPQLPDQVDTTTSPWQNPTSVSSN